MSKRKKKSRFPGGLIALIALAALLFVAGEAWVLFHSEAGQLRLARWLPGGDRPRATRLIAKHIRRGLTAVEIPPDSVRESGIKGGPAPLRWRVGLRPDQSLFQANYAITHYVEEQGGVVLSGREAPGGRAGTEVRLVVGLPKLATHEVVLVRGPREEAKEAPGGTRVALVLYGFGDDPEDAETFFRLAAPFAVAIVAGDPHSGALFRGAHAASREVVVQLPLEPVNYPQVNPGAGTVLVTMKPAVITGLTRRYLDQASPVVAVSNHMGSLATQDMAVMGAVFRELKRRRVPFMHVTPAAGAVCKTLAADVGVAYLEPDAMLDGEARQPRPKKLEQRWAEILKRAKTRGRLVAWVRATPLTRQWLPKAASPKKLDGVDLVPLSALLRRSADLP
jgi:polysaccharide deacetylase 2 family uncharacterized protein YibQ